MFDNLTLVERQVIARYHLVLTLAIVVYLKATSLPSSKIPPSRDRLALLQVPSYYRTESRESLEILGHPEAESMYPLQQTYVAKILYHTIAIEMDPESL